MSTISFLCTMFMFNNLKFKDESITLRRSVEDLGFFLAFLKDLAATGGVASMRILSLSSLTSSDNSDTSLSFFLEEVIYKQTKNHEGCIITNFFNSMLVIRVQDLNVSHGNSPLTLTWSRIFAFYLFWLKFSLEASHQAGIHQMTLKYSSE